MPLTIQHQADSAGDKAVSLITNNGGTNVAAAHKGANLATQNGDSVADLVVTLDGETVTLAAQKNEDTAHTTGDPGLMALAVRKDAVTALAGTDGDYAPLEVDAVGALHTVDRAGYADNATFTRGTSRLLAGLAGIYESTVSTLTAGRVALARLTSRGAVVTAADTRFNYGSSSTVTEIGDIEASTNIVTGMATPTTASFDGVTIGAAAMYYKIPMVGWRSAFVGLRNNGLGVDLTVSVSLFNHNATGHFVVIGSFTVANNGYLYLSPLAGGTGVAATLETIPALETPCAWIQIAVTPASAPGAGSVLLSTVRRS